VPLLVAEIIAMSYPLADYPSPDLALAAVGTGAAFACNSRKAAQLLSQYVPTFAYEFNDENAPQLFLPPVSFPYGSAHASEIQYLFNLRTPIPWPGLTHDQRRLARAMTTYWTNFARTGSPNWFGQPFWPAYDSDDDEMQSLVPAVPELETGFALDHKCSIWTPTP
jgi:para-nitrobenzyl esterase